MADSSSPASRVLESGAVIGTRYEIIRHIGTGGMASVYLVRDTENNRECALKLLHKEFADDEMYLERFLREVTLLKSVNHPNIIRTYDAGSTDGFIFYTMEYIPGATLDDILDRKEFSLAETCNLIINICQGLRAVHLLDIVHRDLKPENILIADSGEIKILDFGVARDKSSRLTQPNQKLGSLCYIAPEVWFGKTPTPAVDLYSLGIMLYELATGNVPFDDPLPGKMLQLHIEGVVQPPQERNPNVPLWLNNLILQLLQKSPKDRPRSAEDVMKTIRMYASELLGSDGAGPDSASTPTERVEPHILSSKSANPTVSHPSLRTVRLNEGKTYVFRLSATHSPEENKPRRKATVIISLPKRAAVVLEIEAPSQDVIAFGIFLASLQVFDGILTSMGVKTWGVHAEGNPLLRWLMHTYGPEKALLACKALAIILVAFMTVIARRKRLFRNLVGALAGVYLFAAILPWLYLLWCKYVI